jgi:hypothetical protein
MSARIAVRALLVHPLRTEFMPCRKALVVETQRTTVREV